jgi:hypothetical protein
MEKGFTSIREKCSETFTIHDDANVGGMIQDLKPFLQSQGRL